ncbi:hypothetical protein [Synechocystis sp. PCC 7509]|uniref:hypothetical protein n=1 Tax=Synechocystis sp. PCC 7509 TaxID=927677 RepID=UPI0002ABFB14|nr:hypothetical protein [Synechocystis sp. PCC 7509]
MNLDQQIQLLIDDAPNDGTMPRLIKEIAPGLKQLAAKLRHEQYYIIQSLNSEWLVTTITNRTLEKRVIYAFPTLQDSFAPNSAELIAAPIPVTHILFQLVALETVDSIIFLETPGEASTGYEVKRQDIQKLIQVQIKPSFNQIPPDIA